MHSADSSTSFSCTGLSVCAPGGGPEILSGIEARFDGRGLHAIVGPSGCGKTTLVRAFLGLMPHHGEVCLGGVNVRKLNSLGGVVGFVPQFSVVHRMLTIEEAMRFNRTLYGVAPPTGAPDPDAQVLGRVGLLEHRSKIVANLSGGQLRRLGLALEMSLNPQCLICDEVTSGLDPVSEDEILDLLRRLAEDDDKAFLCIIHNLAQLRKFDSVTVLLEGRLVFQGSCQALCDYFSIDDPARLFHALRSHSTTELAQRWAERGDEERGSGEAAVAAGEAEQLAESAEPVATAVHRCGSVWQQTAILLRRQLCLIFRDRLYLGLLAALTFGFPVIVVLFAIDGLPQIQGLDLVRQGDLLNQFVEDIRYQRDAAETAALITGLIMFQAILLTLMGANNGSREIAGERRIYEKERLSGLLPGAYAASKLVFCGTVAAAQGAWMAVFVKVICGFPGALLPQVAILALCCLAMTFVCLGISAFARSTEQATLLSIYLVGFQLPLSGVVLALPDALVWVFRPFINAYWAWAGYLSAMRDSRFYDAFRLQDTSWLPSSATAYTVLLLHALAGAVLVVAGCKRTIGST